LGGDSISLPDNCGVAREKHLENEKKDKAKMFFLVFSKKWVDFKRAIFLQKVYSGGLEKENQGKIV
jgi:hypothetical protein